MAFPAIKYISPVEYMAIEVNAETKHEYFDGKMVAMTGATESHNRIVANLIGELHSFLKDKDCDVFPSDLRVTTPLFSSYMYPDVSIVCGSLEKLEGQFDTITNPSVVIEVMSPSTQERDLGFKFWYYLQIPTLKEYILIDVASVSIKKITKLPDGAFKASTINDLAATLYIETINIELPLQEIYRKVTFEQV